ncbi:hypothetical protein RhiirA4_474353 [Rhizophagus irregularis]|uniref:Uncharacterized protein n=1 Tax=Rhizophagus irregularis TaxID=588596 RepID=A0A2I1H893_9GLOM|nr:hypothetical protein RhiirA4_474353 [Rhizophagus irregularis]
MSEQRFRDHIMIMTKESEQPGEIINERIMNGGRENLSQTNMSKSKEKGKQKDLVAGFMELMQLESFYQMNVRKRKVSEAFNVEFLYEIVTTATDWHFLTERIYCTKADYHIALTEVFWKTMGNFIEMLRYRTITSRDSLRKITQRAVKFYKLLKRVGLIKSNILAHTVRMKYQSLLMKKFKQL